jgi:hypothetical protein
MLCRGPLLDAVNAEMPLLEMRYEILLPKFFVRAEEE